MPYPGSGQSKSYDRLRVPERSERRRPHISTTTEYTDGTRRHETARMRSQTLQYTFNFDRSDMSEQGSRKRLSAPPEIVKRRDGRTIDAPSASPSLGRSQPTLPPKQATQLPQAARHPEKSPVSKNKSGHYGHDRPAAASVTDFQRVKPTAPNVRGSTIRAPRLSDMNAPGITQPNRTATKPVPGGTPVKSGDGSAHSASPASRPHGPSRPFMNPARGVSDQSASTVVGFDISRSVFERGARQPEVSSEQPVEARVEWNARRFRNMLSTVLVIAVVFVMLAVSLMLTAQVSAVSRQNSELERLNEQVEQDIRRVQMQIALEEDLSNVKERAEELGLSAPDEDRIEYVDLNDGSAWQAPSASE